mmetsp:Transcript_47343/g.156959  ORF Transcript_47343/g.156959 Transcript_47343/m.156959 type:complete len:233 (-) Transcript_47343:1123-1821(-)
MHSPRSTPPGGPWQRPRRFLSVLPRWPPGQKLGRRDARVLEHARKVDARRVWWRGQQRLGWARLHERAARHEQQLRRVADREEAVRNHEDRPREMSPHGRLDERVGRVVHVRSRLVHDEDGGPREKRPREAEALSFSLREVAAVVDDVGVELLGQRPHDCLDARIAQRRPHRPIVVLAKRVEVLPQAAREEKRLLHDERQPRPQLVQPEPVGADAVYLEVALVRLRQPEEGG